MPRREVPLQRRELPSGAAEGDVTVPPHEVLCGIAHADGAARRLVHERLLLRQREAAPASPAAPAAEPPTSAAVIAITRHVAGRPSGKNTATPRPANELIAPVASGPSASTSSKGRRRAAKSFTIAWDGTALQVHMHQVRMRHRG